MLLSDASVEGASEIPLDLGIGILPFLPPIVGMKLRAFDRGEQLRPLAKNASSGLLVVERHETRDGFGIFGYDNLVAFGGFVDEP